MITKRAQHKNDLERLFGLFVAFSGAFCLEFLTFRDHIRVEHQIE